MKTLVSWTPADGGACSTADPVQYDFFPDLYDEDAEVPVPSAIKHLCQVICPFGRDGSCLKWALTHDAYGFWAATSRYQRNQLGRDRHRVKCPGCLSTAVMSSGRGEVCMSCGVSWLV